MKYIKVFTDFVETIEILGDAERGRLFTAMLKYAESSETPDLRGNERFIWSAAKQMIDREAKAYEEMCKRNKLIATTRHDSSRLVTTRHDSLPLVTTRYQDKDKDKDKEKEKSTLKSTKRERPTEEEVAKYIEKNGLSVDPHEFFQYFEEGNWHDSKGEPVRNWKQKLLTWNKYKASAPKTKKMGSNAGYKQTALTEDDFASMFVDLDKEIL